MTTIYEFDTNGNVGAGNVAIAINAGWSTTQIGNAVVTAINGAGTTVVAALGQTTAGQARISLLNDTVVDATQFHMSVLANNPAMRLGAVKDGDTFTVVDPGGTPTTFEFDTGDGVATDNVAVPIPNPDGMEVQGPNALVQFSNAMTDGTTITLTDNQGNTTTFEFDTDGSVTAGNVAIDISVTDGMTSQGSTPLLQFNKNISDGDTFTVDGAGSQTFEFDSDGNTVAGNVVIPFDPVPSDGLSVESVLCCSASNPR